MLTALKKAIGKIHGSLHHFRAKNAAVLPRVFYDVPYHSQFASPELAEEFITYERDVAADPNWAKTGARTIEEYVQWAHRGCGMACFAMALEYITGEHIPFVRFGKAAHEHGVYKDDGPTLSPMHYEPFVSWANQHFPVTARFHAPMSIESVYFHLHDARLVIASVNPNIRGVETAPTMQKGGHLVLVTGYDKDNGTLYINNPTGFASNDSQHHHEVSHEWFVQHFAERGLSIQAIS